MRKLILIYFVRPIPLVRRTSRVGPSPTLLPTGHPFILFRWHDLDSLVDGPWRGINSTRMASEVSF